MKNKFIRIISSLLVLSFLTAAFSVLSFAESADSTAAVNETYDDPITDNFVVFYNRNYEEGWAWNNGFDTATKYTYTNGNALSVDYEEDMHGNYNYFTRFQVASDKAAQAMIRFSALAITDAMRQDHKGTVIEFSIKADDVANVGNILSIATTGKSATIKVLDINAKGELVAFIGREGGNKNLGKLDNEWVNLAFIFDWTKSDLTCQLRVQSGLGETVVETLTMGYDTPGDVGISTIAFGIPALASRSNTTSAESMGMSFCIDNLKVYQGVRQVVEIAEDEHGKHVDTLAEKVVDIREGANVKTKEKLLEEALALKVGVDYALVRNVRTPLVLNSSLESYNGAYGAPVKVDGNVLVPLQLILDYIGFPSYVHPDNLSLDITTGQSTTYIKIGSAQAAVDSKTVDLKVAPGYIENSVGEKYLVLSIEDIPVLFPGWLTVYDDMGLILLYEDVTPENLNDNDPIVNRKDNLDTMLNIMKKFVFDNVSGDYSANGEKVYNDVEKNTEFNHPYIIADAETFENLAELYALGVTDAGYNAKVSAYIESIVNSAASIYAGYAKSSGSAYAGLYTDRLPSKPSTTDGYDEHGEMTSLVNFTKLLPTLAFAYQVTGDAKYAALAYDMSVYVAGYTHWGPGYPVHFAEISSAVAISYDWLYNAYVELGLNTKVIANAIYDLGVHDGYVASAGKTCEHGRGLGDLSLYTTTTGSTNAIATSGMMISALAILDYIGSEDAPRAAYTETLYLIGSNMQSLVKYGLDIYAPDGTYIESPTYWESATSAFFRMVMAFESAANTDYGFMDSWAMEKTCYYAIYIESPEGYIWNYHDSAEFTSLNTDMFFFAGAYYGDSNLVSIRLSQLEKGRAVSIYDLLFYPFDGVSEAPKLELDYYMEAIEGFVSRSDWNSGAIYTGLMGGMNNVDHGQLDSGNFIYHNKGVAWIMDLGTENPYLSGIKDAATRYKFYRNSAEGQNVIINVDDTSLPYGQKVNAGGVITKTYSNEHGSYVLLNNTAVHKSSTANIDVSKAHRGVLMTNDRSTVVLQDEFAFIKIGSLAWVLHTKALVSIDPSGRIAYLTATGSDGVKYTLRLSIVSKRTDFGFKLESATKSILPAVTSVSGENSRNNISKLVIETTAISFDMAVVFELVENDKDTSPVTYSWTYMSEWEPSEYIPEKIEQTGNLRGNADKESIISCVDDAKRYLDRKNVYTEKLFDLYRSLTDAKYIINACSNEFSGSQVTAKVDYQRYAKDYDKFLDYVNGCGDTAGVLSGILMGIQPEADAEE